EKAIILRFGRFHRQLEPGFHWMWPLGVEEVYADNVVTRTKNIAVQSLTTADLTRVNLGIVITANIEDIKASVLNVEGVDDALMDAVCGSVGSMVKGETYEQLMDPDWENRAT